jgi:hypothetical protein
VRNLVILVTVPKAKDEDNETQWVAQGIHICPYSVIFSCHYTASISLAIPL